MAWRIDNAVIRGEIDNTVPGRTNARIWLIHQDEPLLLNLEGDCWRDLAGSLLTFVNPNPDHDLGPPELANPQTGQVGDMTASRKCRVFTDTPDHRDFTWKNMLSLEWFDQVNGRVLIEAPGFEIFIHTGEWRQTEQQESAQKIANQNAMRDYIAAFIRRSEQGDVWTSENANEYQWEQRLRESDRLAEAFQEVLEKYGDDQNYQRKQAYAMGWDSMTGVPGINDPLEFELDGVEMGELFEDDLDEEWDSELIDEEYGEYTVHPLQQKAHESANAALDFLGALMDTNDAASKLCTSLMQVASKLAGALNFSSEDFEQEPGYVLAILKRCLHWQNDAIAACQELMSKSNDMIAEQSLKKIRDSIFHVRDQITELRRELKQN
jgi:hypothetical protein